jgi:hypothetical protein
VSCVWEEGEYLSYKDRAILYWCLGWGLLCVSSCGLGFDESCVCVCSGVGCMWAYIDMRQWGVGDGVCVCVCVPWQAGLIPCGQTSIVRPNLIYFVCVCVLCVATSCGGGCSNKEGDPPGLLKDGTLCKGTHNRSRGKFLFISFDTVCVFVLISR